jgi:nicotinate-nucleotide adenylyltransferase
MEAKAQTKERIGIVGGSFNPVHFGHLIIAQDAWDHLALSKLIFVPAAIPPHKVKQHRVSAEHRLNMLRLALADDERFEVSDIEIQRGGISYSIDTVLALQKENPNAELFFLMGSDSLVELHTWNRVDELVQACTIVTLLRPGEDTLDKMTQKIKLPPAVRTRLMQHVVDAHRIEISSTEIRRRIEQGLSIRYLLPRDVENYIFENKLYHDSEG